MTELERVEAAILAQTVLLKQMVGLLQQLVDAQFPSFPATTKIDVKVT